MIEKFLKAKHWQLFILVFGIPVLCQTVLMITMFVNILNITNQNNPIPNPSVIFNYFLFFPVIMILVMAVQFGWFWSVAIGLQNKVPENVKMKVKKFKIFFFIPLIYIILISLFIVLAMYQLPVTEEPSNTLIIGFLIVLPLHFFSMFCTFYSIYFVAKTFKTVELQREVYFSDFLGEFFLLWFYPIGVWIIQPKINKIIEN